MQNETGKKQEKIEIEKEAKRFVDLYELSIKNAREATEKQTDRIAILVDQQARKWLELYESNAREAAKSAEKVARMQSRKTFQMIAGWVITVVLAVGGFFVNDYFQGLEHARDLSKAEIQRKLEKLESISAALTDVRTVKDAALIECGTQTYDAREIERKRLAARNLLVKAIRNADFYFGRSSFDSIASFMDWEAGIKDYCDKNLPPDSEWRAKQRKIESEIRKTFPESTFNH